MFIRARATRRSSFGSPAPIASPRDFAERASAAPSAFIEQASAHGARCVLVITGKGGAGFKERGVLHRRFPEWVNAPALRERISRVAPAHVRHGGGGAWYVFLKRRGRAI
ncbi:MAG: Smr/MutS family protein [Pseudomonadota bacterium]